MSNDDFGGFGGVIDPAIEKARLRRLAEADAAILEALAHLVRLTGIPVEEPRAYGAPSGATTLQRWLGLQMAAVGR